MIRKMKPSIFYPRKQKLQTYNDDYIKPGFLECPSDVAKSQYLVGYKTLSNESMKPAKLKKHLTTHHPE